MKDEAHPQLNCGTIPIRLSYRSSLIIDQIPHCTGLLCALCVYVSACIKEAEVYLRKRRKMRAFAGMEESYINIDTHAANSPARGARKRASQRELFGRFSDNAESPTNAAGMNLFSSREVKLSKKNELLERLNEFLEGQRNVLEAPICPPCLTALSNACEARYSDYQKQIRAYTVTEATIRQQKRDTARNSKHSSSGNNSKNNYVNEIEDDSDSDDNYELYQAIDEAEATHQQLQTQCSEYLEQQECVRNDRKATSSALQTEMSDIIRLESEIRGIEEDLSVNLSLINSSSREIELFDSSNFLISRPLYDICSDGLTFSINGLRLKYLPTPALNLNWSEINSAWCSVALCILSVRYKYELPEHIGIIKARHRTSNTKHHSRRDDEGDIEFIGLRIQLRPLRKRVFVLQQSYVLENTDGPRDEAELDNMHRIAAPTVSSVIDDRTFILEGSQEAIREYRLAIVYLAVLLVVTLSQISRLELLDNAYALSALHAALRTIEVNATSDDDGYWGYGEEDLDYYDIDAEECNSSDRRRDGMFYNCSSGDKVEKLVVDILTTLVAMSNAK
jgi:hypothetical protein